MAKHEAERSKTLLHFIVFIIIIALLCLGIYFVLNRNAVTTNGGVFSKNIKEETITAENYEEMMDKIEEKMKNDEELYYLSYSMMYYMMKDGLASGLSGNTDENVIYTNIYNKTVQQLIDEGKQLMKDNNMTLEKFKQEVNNLNNNIEE